MKIHTRHLHGSATIQMLTKGDNDVPEFKDLATVEQASALFRAIWRKGERTATLFVIVPPFAVLGYIDINEECASLTDIFRSLLIAKAVAVIIGTPSKSAAPYPDGADLIFAMQFNSVATKLGIHLLDHIIVGQDSHFSLSENKFI